jgi:hypothetical protein
VCRTTTLFLGEHIGYVRGDDIGDVGSSRAGSREKCARLLVPASELHIRLGWSARRGAARLGKVLFCHGELGAPGHGDGVAVEVRLWALQGSRERRPGRPAQGRGVDRRKRVVRVVGVVLLGLLVQPRCGRDDVGGEAWVVAPAGVFIGDVFLALNWGHPGAGSPP